MTSNLSLWSTVERTDPAHTKPITGKAYSGNSPKPYYLVHKATETFGPCGLGWGFEIVEEKLLDGAMLEPDFYERIHMARVKVWYRWNGERGEIEHVGQTVFSGRRKDGKPFTDEDAPKKSVTDALVKALSMIGFAGDIFMGRFDDSKYVAEVRREIAEERRDTKPPAQQPDAVIGPSQAAQRMTDHIRQCTDGNDLRDLKATDEFRAFWRSAGEVDRRFVQDAAAAAMSRFAPAEKVAA